MKDLELVYIPYGISWARSTRKGRTFWHAIRKYGMYYRGDIERVASLSAVKACGDSMFVDAIELTRTMPATDVCEKCKQWASRR